MKYLDYYALTQEAYTLAEAANIMGITSDQLWFLCYELNVVPKSANGVAILSRYEVRHIHNVVYKRERNYIL